MSIHSRRFPGESAAYREARDELLRAEAELRRQVETVAEEYVFEEGASDLDDEQTKHSARLSELFEDGKDTLAVYSFMYGPSMAKACPMCTSFLDSLDGTAPHALQRINLAVVAKSPIERIRQHARARGWGNLRLLSSAQNSYNRDYGAETPDGAQLPVFNVFVRRAGKIHHFYNTELLYAPREPGRDPCHIDLIWPLWNLFDLTPEGRGTDWYPQLEY